MEGRAPKIKEMQRSRTSLRMTKTLSTAVVKTLHAGKNKRSNMHQHRWLTRAAGQSHRRVILPITTHSMLPMLLSAKTNSLRWPLDIGSRHPFNSRDNLFHKDSSSLRQWTNPRILCPNVEWHQVIQTFRSLTAKTRRKWHRLKVLYFRNHTLSTCHSNHIHKAKRIRHSSNPEIQTCKSLIRRIRHKWLRHRGLFFHNQVHNSSQSSHRHRVRGFNNHGSRTLVSHILRIRLKWLRLRDPCCHSRWDNSSHTNRYRKVPRFNNQENRILENHTHRIKRKWEKHMDLWFLNQVHSINHSSLVHQDKVSNSHGNPTSVNQMLQTKLKWLRQRDPCYRSLWVSSSLNSLFHQVVPSNSLETRIPENHIHNSSQIWLRRRDLCSHSQVANNNHFSLRLCHTNSSCNSHVVHNWQSLTRRCSLIWVKHRAHSLLSHKTNTSRNNLRRTNLHKCSLEVHMWLSQIHSNSHIWDNPKDQCLPSLVASKCPNNHLR